MRFLLAAVLLLAPQQTNITDPEWVCTFSLKGDKPLVDPIVHVHILVHGRSEADAAIRAHSHLSGFIVAEEKIVFLEAALKK